MPRSRPSLLPGRSALLVRPLVGRSLVGRLTSIWLLMSVRLRWWIRQLTLVRRRLPLPLVRLALVVRIPWWLLAHDAPPHGSGAVLSHVKNAPKTLEVC